MFTHSDLRKFACRILNHKALMVWAMLLLLSPAAYSQSDVTISIQVMPPFTSKLYDYLQPNKITVSVRNTTTRKLDVYFLGTISGGNVNIYTDPSYKMSYPLTLQPGIEVKLTGPEIERVLDPAHMIFSGITKEEIIHDNLPEESYNACFKAFDYYTDAQLSGDAPQGCSNSILVTNLEPPTIIAPVCEQEINATNPQFLNIAWTRPPGATPDVRYRLQMFEVLPSHRNPYDAINTASMAFFTKELSVNSYLYGPSDPGLIVGKQYVFIVTAFDLMGTIVFRNHGQSAACSFIYRSTDLPNQSGQILPCDTCYVSGSLTDTSCNCTTWDKKLVTFNYNTSKTMNPLCGSETSITMESTAVKVTPDYTCSLVASGCKVSYQYKVLTLPDNVMIINSSSTSGPLEFQIPRAGSYLLTITPACGSRVCGQCSLKLNALQGTLDSGSGDVPDKTFIESKEE